MAKLQQKAANNWSFLPIKTDKQLDVRFETSPSEKAANFIKDFAQYPMTFCGKCMTISVFAIYKIDLTEKN